MRLVRSLSFLSFNLLVESNIFFSFCAELLARPRWVLEAIRQLVHLTVSSDCAHVATMCDYLRLGATSDITGLIYSLNYVTNKLESPINN